jgi:hypothetical protein
MTPQPGDFAVVNTVNEVAAIVQLMEAASGGGFSEWNHAVVCTRIDQHGVVWIAEAEPGGAVEAPWHYEDVPHRWSTGLLPTSQAVADAAARYCRPGPWGARGVPYSFLDYAAIAAHRWRLPLPGLRGYVAATGHMICSQLVDRCFQDAGLRLFADNRWNGYVRPSDLGGLLPTERPTAAAALAAAAICAASVYAWARTIASSGECSPQPAIDTVAGSGSPESPYRVRVETSALIPNTGSPALRILDMRPGAGSAVSSA